MEKPVEYGQLLKGVMDMAGGEDPMEELRRRIVRTRAKMESQHQVMDGFLSDVRQMHQIDKSFSSAELSTPSSPAGVPALTSGASSKTPALTSSSSATELVPHRRSSSSTTELVPQRRVSAARPSSASKNVRTVSL